MYEKGIQFMVYNVVGPGNVYALFDRHCGPHSSSLKRIDHNLA